MENIKLATSTDDFGRYVDSIAEKVNCFQESNFKYITLEQSASPEFMGDSDEPWKALADQWGEAAASSGLTYVVSHAPCLHFPVPEALSNPQDETYRANIRAIRRSIEVCHILGIPRIVVHACPHNLL